MASGSRRAGPARLPGHRRLTAMAAAAVAAGTVAACASSGGGSSGAGGTAGGSGGSAYTIHAILSVTGPKLIFPRGLTRRPSLMELQKLVNSSGGIQGHPVSFDIADNQSTAVNRSVAGCFVGSSARSPGRRSSGAPPRPPTGRWTSWKTRERPGHLRPVAR